MQRAQTAHSPSSLIHNHSTSVAHSILLSSLRPPAPLDLLRTMSSDLSDLTLARQRLQRNPLPRLLRTAVLSSLMSLLLGAVLLVVCSPEFLTLNLLGLDRAPANLTKASLNGIEGGALSSWAESSVYVDVSTEAIPVLDSSEIVAADVLPPSHSEPTRCTLPALQPSALTSSTNHSQDYSSRSHPSPPQTRTRASPSLWTPTARLPAERRPHGGSRSSSAGTVHSRPRSGMRVRQVRRRCCLGTWRLRKEGSCLVEGS